MKEKWVPAEIRLDGDSPENFSDRSYWLPVTDCHSGILTASQDTEALRQSG